MGRHRRAKVVLGARSTAVKAAAAMGVATALAVGINSAASGPSVTQATADTSGDPVANLADHSASGTGHSSTTQTRESVPTGFATESAGTPKLIRQTPVQHTAASTGNVHQISQSAPAPSASQPAAQPTQPSGSASAPSGSGSGSASSAPAPAQGTGSTGGQQGQGGGLLGTVVGTVGGVVGGLLG